jgi:hypothetical protein
MTWFADLSVHRNSDALDGLIPLIEPRMEPELDRDLETEPRAADRRDLRWYLIRHRRASCDLGLTLPRYPHVIAVDDIRIYPGKVLTALECSRELKDFIHRYVEPAADRLGLQHFSTGFEDRFPAWARHCRRDSKIEAAFGFHLVVRLREEGYIGGFPVRKEIGSGVPVDRASVAQRLLEMSPWQKN